jgi:phosphoglycerate dehydrogenase-like enzyme
MSGPRVAILPRDKDELYRDVTASGGEVVEPDEAEGIIYTDARDPSALTRVLETSPAKWIQLPFAGIEPFIDADVIDSAHTWTCAKGIYGPSTAEHALTLMLAAARKIPYYARARSWAPRGGERMLKDALVVLVGTGGIGRALASMLTPLGPRLAAVNRSGKPMDLAAVTETVDKLGDLVVDADFVVLATALTKETRGLVNRELLHRMSSNAWIVNVGRGGLIVTGALVDALERRAIGGAALDVTDPEPLPDNHPLWGLDNALITPHIANTWNMALPELRALIRRNVERYAAGEPLEGLVDPSLGY